MIQLLRESRTTIRTKKVENFKENTFVFIPTTFFLHYSTCCVISRAFTTDVQVWTKPQVFVSPNSTLRWTSAFLSELWHLQFLNIFRNKRGPANLKNQTLWIHILHRSKPIFLNTIWGRGNHLEVFRMQVPQNAMLTDYKSSSGWR